MWGVGKVCKRMRFDCIFQMWSRLKVGELNHCVGNTVVYSGKWPYPCLRTFRESYLFWRPCAFRYVLTKQISSRFQTVRSEKSNCIACATSVINPTPSPTPCSRRREHHQNSHNYTCVFQGVKHVTCKMRVWIIHAPATHICLIHNKHHFRSIGSAVHPATVFHGCPRKFHDFGGCLSLFGRKISLTALGHWFFFTCLFGFSLISRDKAAMLRDLTEVIKSQLGVKELQIVTETESVEGFESQRDSASPGKPQIVFQTES